MATPAPSLPKPRPYRRFLTSALHTRFVHAAAVSFLLAWDNAIWLGPKRDFLWFWFPLGPAGLRALLFCLTNLFIFFLQIATLRVGRPTSPSPISRFRSYVLSLLTAQTFFWYLVSAWWFSEAYIWSNPDLTWVTKGDVARQDKLNEKPIYFRTFFSVLAIAQAFQHLYYDRSTIHIPVSPPPSPQTNDNRTHPIENKYSRLRKEILPVITRSVIASLVISATTPFLYSILLRQVMWKIHLALAKPFFNLSRSNARATGIPPIVGTMVSTILTGFLLTVTWEISSLLFVTFLGKEPTKKDMPLSAASKDPNGTLLTGLKAKREIVKTFAFWELVIIAQSNADRRRSIFTDIDRPTGPIFLQMLQEALKVLKAADDRISPPAPSIATANGTQAPIESLPKIVPEIKGDNIFQQRTPNGRIRKFLEAEAKKLGSSPEPWRPQLDQAVKMIEYSKSADIRGSISSEIKQSPAAWFFFSTNAARINATVLGSPSGNAAILVDAVEAATRMLIASLQEDLYGNAIKGVPSAVKQFTTSITLIEAFLQKNSPRDGDISEVEVVLARLKAGLRELLAAFQTFLSNTALGIGELNAATRASGQTTIEEQKETEPLDLLDAPAPLPVEDARDRPGQAWAARAKQKTSREKPQGRLQENEAPTRLFTRQEPQRKGSREGVGRTIHVPRRREMEHVR